MARSTYFEGRGIPDLSLTVSPEDAARLLRDSSRYRCLPAWSSNSSRRRAGIRWRSIEIPAGLRGGQRLGTEPLDDPLMGGAAVERAFGSRVGGPSEPARRAFLVAADERHGRPARDPAGAGPDATGLDEAEAAGLIIVDGGRLRFRHPLVRSAVHSGASGGDRRAAHAALAHALVTALTDRACWHRALPRPATTKRSHRSWRGRGRSTPPRGCRGAGGLPSAARADAGPRAASAAPPPCRPRRAPCRARGLCRGLLDEALELAGDPLLRADLVEGRTAGRPRTRRGRRLARRLSRAGGSHRSAQDPERALQLLWHVLWRLIESSRWRMGA